MATMDPDEFARGAAQVLRHLHEVPKPKPIPVAEQTVAETGHDKWVRETLVKAKANVQRLRAKRSLNQSDLAMLDRDEKWLADMAASRADASAYLVWRDRVAKAMPEFTVQEAKMIAMHAPVPGYYEDAKPWASHLPAILRELTEKRSAANGALAFTESGRTALLSAALTAERLSSDRLTQLEMLVLGTRIGRDPHRARYLMDN